ncbi:DUF6633 family protein [Sphingobacterium sp. 2149]|uniref:DUF6633 family protein n=1 Tax=Sphingobacterium sp. 2149 TaxID=2817763 RepID=UPI00286B83B8|nr:DUF6633 family protein [Sphingobacterium sp. 2149]
MQLVTHQQAINSGLPTIRKLGEESKIVLSAYITEFIEDALSFLNLGKTMSDVQIAQTVTYLIEDYPNVNLADLKLFFKRFKKGVYGKFFDRIDGQVIIEAFTNYNSERMDLFEQQNQRDHYKSKRDERNNVSLFVGAHPDVIKVLKSAVGEKKLFAPEPQKPRVKTEAEIFHQRALRQFDNLFRKFGEQVSSVRFLVFGKERYTLDKFIERKIYNLINSQSFE